MAAIEPMEQFLVHKVVDLPPIPMPGLGSIDMSITNSVLFMLIAAGLISTFFFVSARRQIVPGRMQALAEMLYDMVDGTLTGGIIGDRGRPFLPFVFTLFLLIAMLNIDRSGARRVHRHRPVGGDGDAGDHDLHHRPRRRLRPQRPRLLQAVLPAGRAPWHGRRSMVFIEFISFMVRPLTLAMRLFGNMLGGHVVTYMFASFVVGLGLFGLAGAGIAKLGLIGSLVSFMVIVALLALEFVVAFLQAFVFAALTCVYLNEVVNLDHGH